MTAAWEPPSAPAYFTIAMAPPVRRPVLDRADGLWAQLHLQGTVLEPLHVGSGVPEPVEDRLAAGVATNPAGGPPGSPERPVVPGSGVKGALRAVFEAVTRSCDPLSTDRCQAATGAACPACALFGLGGRRGALAISDLSVRGELGVRHVAQRYSHPDAPLRGRRLYGLEPEVSATEDAEALLVIERGAQLAGTLSVRGAELWAAGALALATGLVPGGLPLVRLGGAKNRGLGVATLTADSGSYAADERAWLLGDRQPATQEVLAGWVAAAQAHPELRADQLDRVKEVYAEHGGS
jgi:CRISPR/Cas system CSM-associated protein Csm3 (group 7 of RAMP superfamily)